MDVMVNHCFFKDSEEQTLVLIISILLMFGTLCNSDHPDVEGLSCSFMTKIIVFQVPIYFLLCVRFSFFIASLSSSSFFFLP